MDLFFQKRAASLLLLLWLTLISVVMLLEFMNADTELAISMENVLIILSVGSILFLVVLAIVRLLFTLLDWKQERNSAHFDSLMVAVDDAGSVYLLPKNASRVIQVLQDESGASIQATDAFIPGNMQSFRLKADRHGNYQVSKQAALSGERTRKEPTAVHSLYGDDENPNRITH